MDARRSNHPIPLQQSKERIMNPTIIDKIMEWIGTYYQHALIAAMVVGAILSYTSRWWY